MLVDDEGNPMGEEAGAFSLIPHGSFLFLIIIIILQTWSWVVTTVAISRRGGPSRSLLAPTTTEGASSLSLSSVVATSL